LTPARASGQIAPPFEAGGLADETEPPPAGRSERGLAPAVQPGRLVISAKERSMAQRICKGDLVQVIAGKERRNKKQGRVLEVDPAGGRVRVEGVRIQKKHLKPNRSRKNSAGGIIEREGFIHISNVMLVDPKTGKPGRVRFELRDGNKVRVFRKSGELLTAPAKK
jgi:large subunit ribosomal protein L24